MLAILKCSLVLSLQRFLSKYVTSKNFATTPPLFIPSPAFTPVGTSTASGTQLGSRGLPTLRDLSTTAVEIVDSSVSCWHMH